MATKKTKTLGDVTTVNTINDDQFIPLTDANGGVTKISIADLKAVLEVGSNDSESESYYDGYNSVISITSVPVDKRLVIASISKSATMAFAKAMTDGRELHIIINNTSDSTITVTLPDSGTLDIEGDGRGEVNIIYAGGTYYIKSV